MSLLKRWRKENRIQVEIVLQMEGSVKKREVILKKQDLSRGLDKEKELPLPKHGHRGLP